MDLQQRRWPDLLPDLLRDISGRLHHAIDNVRFHAVCRPWRDSHDAMATRTTTQSSFLPWLFAPNTTNCDALRLTCAFSNTSYPAPPLPARPHWVANADGTAVRYFGCHPHSSLHEPLTGVTTFMPPVPVGEDRWFHYFCPEGVVYPDGTVLLCNRHHMSRDGTTRFRAALMRPGDTAWTVVERTLEALYHDKFYVAYHGGKILVSVHPSRWHVVMLNDDAATDQLVQSPSMPTDHDDYYYKSGHVLESRGELLWVTLHIPNLQDGRRENIRHIVQTLSLSVYAIQEEEVSVSEKIRWVRKDGRSLADRVFFLGWINNFAIDASRLGVDGGYAYFVYSGGDVESLNEWSAVFRYNLIDNKTKFVDWLPQGWRDDTCAWLLPHPTIAPIHVCTM